MSLFERKFDSLSQNVESKDNDREELLRIKAELVETRARLIEFEAENKKLREEIEKAGFDGLTSLQRNEFLEPTLYDYILELNYSDKEHRERKTSNLNAVAVFFVDMDFLKNFNDDYGYEGGSAALRALAHRSKDIFSKIKDSGFRYGGDEFVFLDPIEDENTNFELFLKRIEREINNELFAEFEYQGKKVSIPIKATIGCFVVKPGDSRTPKEIITSASDQMLATKKARGTARK